MITTDVRQLLRFPNRRQTAVRTWLRPLGSAIAGAILLATAAPAAGQVPQYSPPVTTELIEWDITPLAGGADFVPGGLAVDDKSNSRFSKVWFATRAGAVRLYRLTPGLNFKKDKAAAKSWDLGGDLTGGVRLRHSNDGRFVFVNVNKTNHEGVSTGRGGIVAIDTKDDSRITWATRPTFFNLSDVAVDTRDGGTTVFTAAPEYDPSDFAPTIDGPVDGVVERLRPLNPEWRQGKLMVPGEVTRYPVGGGAGSCVDDPFFGFGAPCLPGIAVDKRRGHPIYVSQPRFKTATGATIQAIAEINPQLVKCPTDPYKKCVRVRHWPLPAELAGPRDISVDDNGKLWGITTSGRLFSIEVERNCDRAILTRHDPEGPTVEDLFAVAPDGGVVGFTDSNNNEVSVLYPEKRQFPISAEVRYIQPFTTTIDGTREVVCPEEHTVEPRSATAYGTKYRKAEDGTYVETDVSTAMSSSPDGSAPSFSPTGIASDGAWKTGAFFYGVTLSDGRNRIGHLSLRVERDKDVDCRRGQHDSDHDGIDDKDDDDVDGDGLPNTVDDDSDNDNIPDVLDDDKNDDGIEDEHQKPGHRETKRSDKGHMGPGESREYEMEYDAHSVSLLAIIEAAELTAPLSIEIVDDDNNVLLRTPPAVGKAIATAVPALPGVYTIRVKNAGLTPVNYKTTIIGSKIPY